MLEELIAAVNTGVKCNRLIRVGCTAHVDSLPRPEGISGLAQAVSELVRQKLQGVALLVCCAVFVVLQQSFPSRSANSFLSRPATFAAAVADRYNEDLPSISGIK